MSEMIDGYQAQKIKDFWMNQPAFPVTERQAHLDGAIVCHEWGGLSKRELFAGMAMQGMLSNPLLLETLRNEKLANSVMIERTVTTSWLFADAMLSASRKDGGKE